MKAVNFFDKDFMSTPDVTAYRLVIVYDDMKRVSDTPNKRVFHIESQNHFKSVCSVIH